jgi:hypothetical protein
VADETDNDDDEENNSRNCNTLKNCLIPTSDNNYIIEIFRRVFIVLQQKKGSHGSISGSSN